MSWIHNMQYQKASSVCECADGTYKVRVVNITEGNINGTKVLEVHLAVNDSSWNKIPYKHTIFEGDNFDYGFSRFCDMLGIDMNANLARFQNGDWGPIIDQPYGHAEFTHTKRKQVIKGYDNAGKPITEWVTEKSNYVNAKLIPAQLEPQQQQQTPPKPATAAQQPSSMPFDEDIPWENPNARGNTF